MKKVNFNSLENFEVPEEWIEKAINAKPKKKPLLLRPYVWGTAASIVLVAAASLFILKPFKSGDSLPAAAGTTAAPTETAKADYTPASTAGTGPAAKPETTDSTEATKSIAGTGPEAKPKTTYSTEATKSTDAPASTTGTVPSTEKTTVPSTVQTDPTGTGRHDYGEPHAHYIPEGQSVYHIDSKWEVDLSSARPNSRSDSAEIPQEPMLTKDELFTGDITAEVSSDSLFYDCETIYIEFSGCYNNGSRKIDGRVILAPKQTEDGKKSATFNLFYDEAYTPSADYTIRIYALNENGSKTDVETLTKPLYSDNSITINI